MAQQNLKKWEGPIDNGLLYSKHDKTILPEQSDAAAILCLTIEMQVSLMQLPASEMNWEHIEKNWYLLEITDFKSLKAGVELKRYI